MFYQNGSRASPAWLLAFYVILALGCISNPAEEPAAARAANEAQALAFFRTGCRSIPTVLFCNRDICGIQALLAAVSLTVNGDVARADEQARFSTFGRRNQPKAASPSSALPPPSAAKSVSTVAALNSASARKKLSSAKIYFGLRTSSIKTCLSVLGAPRRWWTMMSP